jgi:tetratricopeptide (TPR) repeat protein
VLSKKPDSSRALVAQGMEHLRGARLDEALPLLERAAAQAPNDAWAQSAYGRILVTRLGNKLFDDAVSAALKQARAVLTRAVELDPDSAFATAMLGYVELSLGTDLPRATTLLERAVRLAPSRDQYRQFLGQSLIRQDHLPGAATVGGPLARGAVEPPAAVDAPPPPEPSASGDSSPRAGLVLRRLGVGERRVLGHFRAIECAGGSALLLVDGDAGTLRLRARAIDDVDFISYRADGLSSLNCGALPAPRRVMVTYRPGADGSGPTATAGDAIAIELLPDDDIPK